MIMVNHVGVAKHVEFCNGVLEKEVADGIVSQGYQEIPLCPGKNHSRNVAPGPRMCVDMTQPRDEKDGVGSRSPNATVNTGGWGATAPPQSLIFPPTHPSILIMVYHTLVWHEVGGRSVRVDTCPCM